MANIHGLRDFETRSSKEYKTAMLNIERHMYDVLGDDRLHALVLGGGRSAYINVFMREFRSQRGVDREMAEMLFQVYLEEWKKKHGKLHPKKYLDALDIPTPPTEKEIEDAWVHESASSDDARRHFGVA
jgi:hypothetical protein